MSGWRWSDAIFTELQQRIEAVLAGAGEELVLLEHCIV